jgi:integrase
MPLTELQIKRMPVRDRRYAVSDGRGLALEMLPTGSASWRYRYQLNGKTEKVSLGPYPALSLKEARQKRDALAADVFRGISPARQKQLEKVAMATASTVKEFSERYFTEVIAKDRKDSTQLRRYLEKEIYPAFGGRPLREVSAQDVQRLVFRKRDNGFESAAAQLRNLLKRIFDYALVCGLVTSNPTHATPTRFITRARPRTRSLSPEEITSYLQMLYRSNIRRQFKLALHIILLTLVRKSELLHARWEHIDYERGEWVIPEAHSKTGKPHLVYMSRQVCAMFQELRSLAGDSELVLPGRGSETKPFASNALNKALEGVSFPIAPFTIHDLRRTGSTILHEQGFSSDVVEKSLNHSIGGVRGVYNRAEYSEQRKVMLQSWADYISGLLKSAKGDPL